MFKYSSGDKPFLPVLFDRTVGKYCSKPYYLDEDEAHKKALEKFVEDYGISWEEMI